MSINKPKCLNRSGNLHKNWNGFKNSFNSFLKSAGIEESDTNQVGALFLETIGPYGFEIADELKLLNLSKDNISSDISLEDLYKNFDKNCQSNSNLTLSRYRFFKAKQGKESFDDFLSSLMEMSKNCEFGDLRDNLLMVQIISRISNKELQDDLYLIINDLDLEKTIQKCSGKKTKKLQKETSDVKNHAGTSRKRNIIEKSETDLNKIIPEGSPSTSKIPRKTTFDKSGNAVSETESQLSENRLEEGEIKKVTTINTSFTCKFCGGNHRYGNCPHYRHFCQLCGVKGHIAKVCPWYQKK